MPDKHVFRGTLYSADYPDGIEGRFEAYDADKALYFVKMRFQPDFIPDEGDPFKVTGDWKFTDKA